MNFLQEHDDKIRSLEHEIAALKLENEQLRQRLDCLYDLMMGCRRV